MALTNNLISEEQNLDQLAEQAAILGKLYDDGFNHYKVRQWHEALNCFLKVEELDAHYKDISTLIEDANHQIALALNDHYKFLIPYIVKGDVIPFLGAGVNLCGRPRRTAFREGSYLPNGKELAAHLVEEIEYPQDESFDLARVSQFVEVMRDTGYLYDRLRRLFDHNYGCTPLHEFLAGLPKVLSAKNSPRRYQLIVTTNYDDVLERAFHAKREEFDLLSYVAEGDDSGKFRHYSFVYEPPPKEPEETEDRYQLRVEQGREEFWSRWPPRTVKSEPIDEPEIYTGLSIERRTIILKIHGAVDRINYDMDSYVITEDDYISYLSRPNIDALIPKAILGILRSSRSRFLFLGYALRDWNLRVILNNLWERQELARTSWSIQLYPKEIDIKFWEKRNVKILDVGLEDYIKELGLRLQNWPEHKNP